MPENIRKIIDDYRIRRPSIDIRRFIEGMNHGFVISGAKEEWQFGFWGEALDVKRLLKDLSFRKEGRFFLPEDDDFFC